MPTCFQISKVFYYGMYTVILCCPGDRTWATAAQWWQGGRFLVNLSMRRFSDFERVLQEPEQAGKAVSILSQGSMNR